MNSRTRAAQAFGLPVLLVRFTPFGVLPLRQPLKLDRLWAGLCLLGAGCFIVRS